MGCAEAGVKRRGEEDAFTRLRLEEWKLMINRASLGTHSLDGRPRRTRIYGRVNPGLTRSPFPIPWPTKGVWEPHKGRAMDAFIRATVQRRGVWLATA